MTGRIVQINVSPGGVPKRPVPRARATRSGIEGDAQRDSERARRLAVGAGGRG